MRTCYFADDHDALSSCRAILAGHAGDVKMDWHHVLLKSRLLGRDDPGINGL